MSKLGSLYIQLGEPEGELAGCCETAEWAADYIESLRKQLAESQKREVMLRQLIPRRIPNGFVSFGKYYSEQEDKFNDPHNSMCKFKRKYLSDCEEALAATEPK